MKVLTRDVSITDAEGTTLIQTDAYRLSKLNELLGRGNLEYLLLGSPRIAMKAGVLKPGAYLLNVGEFYHMEIIED